MKLKLVVSSPQDSYLRHAMMELFLVLKRWIILIYCVNFANVELTNIFMLNEGRQTKASDRGGKRQKLADCNEVWMTFVHHRYFFDMGYILKQWKANRKPWMKFNHEAR